MADAFIRNGFDVVTGGTDNHLFLVDLSKTHPDVSGREVQDALDKIQITLNKNCVPGEKRSPKEASGIRIGTAAMTTKGYTAEEFVQTALDIGITINKLQAAKK
jgi:glycine hydroxymethyltransferase